MRHDFHFNANPDLIDVKVRYELVNTTSEKQAVNFTFPVSFSISFSNEDAYKEMFFETNSKGETVYSEQKSFDRNVLKQIVSNSMPNISENPNVMFYNIQRMELR